MYGLSDKIGNVSFYDSQGNQGFTKPYSEDTAKTIDEEVSKMIEEQYQRALAILTENKDKLTTLAEKLLTAEVIFKEDLELIFGKRAWEKAEPIESPIKNEVDKSLETDTPETRAEPSEASEGEPVA